MSKNFNNVLSNLNIWVKARSKKFWVIFGIIILFVGFVFFRPKKPVVVESTKVTKGDIVETVSTSGTIKADGYVQLTFPSGGLINKVGVKPGQKVTKGQFIAQIDSVVLNAAYQNALNSYRSTQAAVELEHDNDKNYGSGETFSQKYTRTAAEVANDNAYNAVLAAKDSLKNATIYAPFSGVIDSAYPTSPGINVSAGSASYIIVDPSSIYFDAEVEETDLPNVTVGQDVNLNLDAYPNDKIKGKVSTVGLVAFTSSTGGNAYHIRISLPDNAEQKYKVGMQGDVDIIFGTVSGVTKVNSSAIFSDGDKNYVWVIRNGVIKKTEISTGATSTDETEIKSGLSSTETVVDNPLSTLKDGQKVSN